MLNEGSRGSLLLMICKPSGTVETSSGATAVSAWIVAQIGSKLLASHTERQSIPASDKAFRATGRCGQVSSPVEIGSGLRSKAWPLAAPTHTSGLDNSDSPCGPQLA